jgi:large subunit ribosomal protein L22
MPGLKTNEPVAGTRAVHRHARISPYKVREVLDLIRNHPVSEAVEVLRFCERDAAIVVGKVLNSAVANAEHNDELDPDQLYISACYADEGMTIKRWRPRARGRATRIRKRTSHVTVVVSRLDDERLARLLARRRAEIAAQRARRVAGARRAGPVEGDTRSRAERRRRRGEPEEEEELEAAEAEAAETEAAETEADEAEAETEEAAAGEEAEVDDEAEVEDEETEVDDEEVAEAEDEDADVEDEEVAEAELPADEVSLADEEATAEPEAEDDETGGGEEEADDENGATDEKGE